MKYEVYMVVYLYIYIYKYIDFDIVISRYNCTKTI